MNNTEQDRATRAAETAARAAAGLNLADNNPLSGRGDSFYEFSENLPRADESMDYGVHDANNLPDPAASFTLDIVKSNNQAGTATFNGSGAN
tara:strand:+ start:231 stop:506 length:276 start_codon:yes stop_codon:yes gene_type:complete